MLPHPRSREELAAIAAYQAGRSAPAGAVKLSSNENPFPPLPGVEAAIADAASTVNRYPDFGSVSLMVALSEWLDVDASQLTVGTGSVAVLGQVINAMAGRGDEVVFAWRSFEAYPILVQLSGARQVRVPLRHDFTHDLDAMAGAVTERTRVVLVCTPNNPTGTAVERAALERLLDQVPTDVLVAIDEAYVEFVRDPASPDALDLATSRPNVVVLRTFSKAYGLAGVRVGYGVGPAPLMTEIRKAQLPFGVTTVAERAAVAALASQAELLRRVDVLVSERLRVQQVLAAMPYAVPESQGNFVWLPLAERSEEFGRGCEEGGVVVRPFAGDGVRVTIGEPHANDRWLSVLRYFLGL
ncbi:MAG TPA: histidinol-phosphate transaminase [Actinomycetes bacterium]|nr:histidinol-phosphate transaminase [Actinomycetes bacterium]